MKESGESQPGDLAEQGKAGVEKDGLGDWRLQAITRLAADLPAAYPGGPSHKAGAPIYLSTSTKSNEYGCVGFYTPSVAALSLNIALRASARASDLRLRIVLNDVISPEGRGKHVALDNLPILYEYFELCMIAVTFSFQALESFCNYMIASKLTSTITLARCRGDERMAADEVERNVATEEELATVLPDILGKASPKGRKEWQDFVKLKDARDATIHLKSHDQYPRAGKLDDSSLFYQFLNSDMRQYPCAAVAMIWHFRPSGEPQAWRLL